MYCPVTDAVNVNPRASAIAKKLSLNAFQEKIIAIQSVMVEDGILIYSVMVRESILINGVMVEENILIYPWAIAQFLSLCVTLLTKWK